MSFNNNSNSNNQRKQNYSSPARQAAAEYYTIMSAALDMARAAKGKIIHKHHYSKAPLGLNSREEIQKVKWKKYGYSDIELT